LKKKILKFIVIIALVIAAGWMIDNENNIIWHNGGTHFLVAICWYTLARMIVDFGPPEEGGQKRELNEGALITCLYCAEVFIHDNNRQLYCKNVE
jgi:hypothetical protein